MFGYFVRPTAVAQVSRTDNIHRTFNEFRMKLFEQTGLNDTRFIAIEVGRHVGYCTVLKSNMRSVPPVHPDVAGKVGEYLAFWGDRVEGPMAPILRLVMSIGLAYVSNLRVTYAYSALALSDGSLSNKLGPPCMLSISYLFAFLR